MLCTLSGKALYPLAMFNLSYPAPRVFRPAWRRPSPTPSVTCSSRPLGTPGFAPQRCQQPTTRRTTRVLHKMICPLFVTLLLAAPPEGEARAIQAARIASEMASAVGRDSSNVHIEYAAAGKGRMAFGGVLAQ